MKKRLFAKLTTIQKHEIQQKYEEMLKQQKEAENKRKFRIRKYTLTWEEYVDRCFNKICKVQELIEQGSNNKEIFFELDNCRNILSDLVKFADESVKKVDYIEKSCCNL